MEIAEEEVVKLIDVKDVKNDTIIVHDEHENSNEELNKDENFIIEKTDNLNEIAANGNCAAELEVIGIVSSTERRSDEPTELSFEKGNKVCIYVSFFLAVAFN